MISCKINLNGHKVHIFMRCNVFMNVLWKMSLVAQINMSSTQEGKKYMDLFVWDSTIAMGSGEMETAMILLPVHRTTHLTFSICVCHLSQ